VGFLTGILGGVYRCNVRGRSAAVHIGSKAARHAHAIFKTLFVASLQLMSCHV
jgi:hypothetical protein